MLKTNKRLNKDVSKLFLLNYWQRVNGFMLIFGESHIGELIDFFFAKRRVIDQDDEKLNIQ